MATTESQGNKKDEDPYSVDYENEAGIQGQKTEEIQKEVFNLKMMLNNVSRIAMFAFVGLVVLVLVILALLAVLIVNTGGGGASTAGPGAEKTPSSAGSIAEETCPPAPTVTCPSCATPTAASDAGMNNISSLSLSLRISFLTLACFI